MGAVTSKGKMKRVAVGRFFASFTLSIEKAIDSIEQINRDRDLLSIHIIA